MVSHKSAGHGLFRLLIVDTNTALITGDDADYHASITRISAGVVGSTSAFPAYNSFKIGQFTSATDGVVVGLIAGATPAHHLLKTSDGGATWTPTLITDFRSLNGIGIDTSGTGYIVGARNFTTSDNGNSWSALYDTAFYGYGELYDIDIKHGLRIIVGQSGGIWRQSASTGLPDQEIKPIVNIFPNPASQTAEIDFGKPVTGTLNLYDMSGRSMQTVSVRGNRVMLNTAGLATGLYTIQVHEATGTITTNMLVRQQY